MTAWLHWCGPLCKRFLWENEELKLMRSLLLSSNLNHFGNHKLHIHFGLLLVYTKGVDSKDLCPRIILAASHRAMVLMFLFPIYCRIREPGYHGDKVPLKYIGNQTVYWRIDFFHTFSEQTKAVFLAAMGVRGHLPF